METLYCNSVSNRPVFPCLLRQGNSRAQIWSLKTLYGRLFFPLPFVHCNSPPAVIIILRNVSSSASRASCCCYGLCFWRTLLSCFFFKYISVAFRVRAELVSTPFFSRVRFLENTSSQLRVLGGHAQLVPLHRKIMSRLIKLYKAGPCIVLSKRGASTCGTPLRGLKEE